MQKMFLTVLMTKTIAVDPNGNMGKKQGRS